MERRSFLKWATNGLGLLFGLVMGIPGVAYLLDPRNRPAPAGEFKPVVRLKSLEIGTPTQVAIRDVRRDAWTLHPNDVIGRVWLIRRDEKTVHAYTTTCPHLGGSINYDPAKKTFICPLHGAGFDLDCRRLPAEQLGHTNPAPRDMDSLEVKDLNQEAAEDPWVAVKYQTFEPAKTEKIARS